MLNRLDPSGKDYDPTVGAKGAIDEMIDKMGWPDEKKAKMKKVLIRIIDLAQFEWNRPTGSMGYCDEWVDEYYSKVKGDLAEINKVGIRISRRGWAVDTFFARRVGAGHNAVRIYVMDNPDSPTTKPVEFFLDDGCVGEFDHVFVLPEFNTKWPKTKVEHTIVWSSESETLEDVFGRPPIGPGPAQTNFSPPISKYPGKPYGS